MQASLGGTLTVSSGVQGDSPYVTQLAAISAALGALALAPSATVGTSPTVIPLPATQTNVVIIQNTDPVHTLAITWTPTGGSSNPVIVLEGQGSILILIETALTGGISALTLTGSAAGTTYKSTLAG